MPRLAVIGYPVGHSRSPAMQNAALAALGLADEWSYEAVEVVPDDFEEKVREMAAGGEYAGVNVTVPHKLAAFAIADTASDTAREIGAANTLSFAAGRIHADNTDADGVVNSLPRAPRDLRALVLGAGGAGKAAAWGLGAAGAEVEIWNRTVARAQQVQIELTGRASEFHVEVKIQAVNVETLQNPGAEQRQQGYDLIVNSTTVGLFGEDPFSSLPLDPKGFAPGQTVVDMVYGAGRSRILEAADEAGATTVDGIEVLVQQGALSLAIWTDREPDLDVMRAAARGRR